jgi:hypothetical protein
MKSFLLIELNLKNGKNIIKEIPILTNATNIGSMEASDPLIRLNERDHIMETKIK